MFAFVISLGKLLKLNSGQEVPNNFNQTKRKLVIPLYQREYKWPNDKICGLIADISLRDKFLGNVIIDELDNCYEIADGQQRITTCLLILMCLYNYHQGSPLEQESIKQFIMPINNKPVLVNDSIGSFISEGVGSLSLSIDADQDCYSQKSDFERAYNAIESSIHEIARKGEIQLEKGFSSYKEQLLEQKRFTVEEYATEVFREITNAPQKYKGIKIDSDYSLLLELTNGETYQIEPGRTLNPSTGQSKVISLSYIAGLNRSSNYAAPVIIDNPLGLFSDEHRTAITKYLPHFSKQVIFMVSTGDLTEKYSDILTPYIKTKYYLANESSGTWSKTTIARREEY